MKINLLNLFKIKKLNKKTVGFTLIEILIYLVVLIIVVSAVSSFLIWAIRSEIKHRVMRETLYNAEKAMTMIGHEIKHANNIYLPTSFFDNHPGQLSLETIKHLNQAEETIYLDFYLCDNQLCFKRQGQDSLALTLDNIEITGLVFEQINSNNIPSIKVFLEANYKNPQNRPEQSASIILKSTFSLRSY